MYLMYWCFAIFRNSQSLLQMIELTLMDSSYVLKIMYELNVLPLALQITAICGNVMVIDIQIYKKNLNFGLENIWSWSSVITLTGIRKCRKFKCWSSIYKTSIKLSKRGVIWEQIITKSPTNIKVFLYLKLFSIFQRLLILCTRYNTNVERIILAEHNTGELFNKTSAEIW